MVIVYSTNFFKEFFFEAVVTINLTVMLVLVTLFISVADRLPKTSYIKMMDYWLIFNLIIPFVEVLLHTYMESLNEDDITKTKKDEGEDEVVKNNNLFSHISFSGSIKRRPSINSHERGAHLKERRCSS